MRYDETSKGRDLTENERLWWGRAIPRPDADPAGFNIERHADHQHAAAACAAHTIMLRPTQERPGTIVAPLVYSDDMGATWRLSELEWPVPR